MIRRLRRAVERLGLANKAVLLLGTFGAALALIVLQTWATGREVERVLDETLRTDAPAEETLRELAIHFRDVTEGYERAVLLGERGLVEHSTDAVGRFRDTAAALGRTPGVEAPARALLAAFDRYDALARDLVLVMLDAEDVLDGAGDLAARAAEARIARERVDLLLGTELRAREENVESAMGAIEASVHALSSRILWAALPVTIMWILAFTYVRFRVVLPLVRLAGAAERVSHGDLRAGAERIPAADDEIGRLVRSFGAMSEGLLATTVSKHFLGNVLDAIEDAVIVVDSRGDIRRVNRGALRLLRDTETLLTGRSLGLLGPDVETAVRNGASGPVTGPARGAAPPSLHARDGTRIPVSLGISPVALDDGTRGTVVVARDLREELAAEAERLRLEQRLGQAAKLESVGQLAAGIAHEINTPIQYVGDNTRFLQDAFRDLLAPLSRIRGAAADGADEDAIRETVADIRRSLGEDAEYLLQEIPRAIDQTLDGVQRVATIVRAMKEFSHPGEDKVSMDLNKAIETTVTVARNEWKYVADMELDLDPALGPVQARPGEINQVILNMVVNAAHAIAGKVRDGGKGVIRIATRDLDDTVEIAITDNGTGIPAAIRNRVFDPFFTTKEVGKGTGQGLSIAHDVICRKHGGTVDLESTEGEGTTFRIRLPYRCAEPAEGAPAA